MLRSHPLRSAPLRAACALAIAFLVLAGGLALIVGDGFVAGTPVSAAPGNPGSPSAATVVYREDFENGTGAATVGLGTYVGADGTTYTADPYWLGYDNCNGVIARYASPTFSAGHCSNDTFSPLRSQNNVRRLADVLGQVAAGAPGGTALAPTNASDATTQANHAVTGWTAEQTGAANLIQFQSSDLDLVASAPRYYNVSVDVAEASCGFLGGANSSQLDFFLDLAGTLRPLSSAPIRACTDASTGEYTSPLLTGGWFNGGNSIRAGRYFSDGSLLITPAELADLRIVMRNRTGAQAGNDSAFDNITLVDATPQLDKAFSPTLVRAGQTSTLTFTITNRDDLGAKADWGFTDELPTGLVVAATPNVGGTCAQRSGAAFVRSAAPGASSIVVTGGDLAADEVSCTITVDVTSTSAGTYTNGPDEIDDVVGLDEPADSTVRFIDPAISLDKTAAPSSVDAAGEVVTYTFTATNTGDSPLTDVTIADPKSGLSPLACTPAQPAALGAGETLSCTATYVATQADVDAGTIDNVASVSGLDETQTPLTDDDDAQVVATQSPAIEVIKDADVPSFDEAGDPIAYTYTVTNTGNVTLDGVTLTDPQPGLGAISCTPPLPTTLAPGASATCTAPYVTTQADVDAGLVDTDASVVGTPPSGADVTDTDDAPVPGDQAGAIDLVKTADPTSFSAEGETIAYDLVATNVGNVTLSDVTIADPLPGLSALDCAPAAPATLAPGESLACTATYVTTQADLDAGQVANAAAATGSTPSGDPVTDEDDAVVPGRRSVAVDVTKGADLTSFSAAGETITYAIEATNTGNVTLTGVVLDDPLPGLSALACDPVAPATLAPGETIACTATYVTTQADVDAGTVDNLVTVTGEGPDGTEVDDEDPADVPAVQTPEITVTKDADVPSYDEAGDPITFTYTATNTGNTTLTDVVIADPQPGLPPLECTPPLPAVLAPGESITCSATYPVSQGDVDAGLVDTDATAVGTPPLGPEVTDVDDAPVPGDQRPAITLTKDADVPSFDEAGDPIGYTYTATNTGNTTLTDVVIVDPQTGLPALGCTPVQPASLAPGEALTCTAIYEATQGDVDAGVVDTTATVTGTAPGGASVTALDDAPVPGAQAPAIALTKDADVPSFDEAGDIITFTYTVTNTGNTTLDSVTVADPLPGLGALVCAPSLPGTLAPGESATCTATYEVTQADVDDGLVDSDATAVGTPPSGADVSDEDDAPVPGDQTSAIDLTKVADVTAFDAPGDVIGYRFEAVNVGNTTLTDVSIADPLAGLSALDCSPAQPATLAPGETLACTATYDATQADLDDGEVANTAVATGDAPDGSEVTDADQALVPGLAAPAIDIVKDVDRPTVDRAGDVVTYTYTVTNTGNVTLDGVTVVDPQPGLSEIVCTPAQPAVIAPGATITCTATYAVTQADVDAGLVDTDATATGTAPDRAQVTDADDEPVTAAAVPAIELTKEADKAEVTVAGQVITYLLVAENTGNVTLDGVEIADPLPGLSALSCSPAQPATLSPGAQLRCVATYEVTQSDLDAGEIDNVATTTGTPPSGDPVSDDDDETVPAPKAPALDLVKSSPTGSFDEVGDEVAYRFTVTNNGNVTLDDVTVLDALEGVSALECDPTLPASLAPGASITCAATYVVTQADLDAGFVTNAATAAATDPDGDPLTDEDAVTVPGEQDPAIELAKESDRTTVSAVGDVVTYVLTATNTGDVTLSDVQIADPLPGLSALECTPEQPATLAPGEELRCTATYAVTADDLGEDELVNVGTVTGTPPSGEPVDDDSSVTVVVDPPGDIIDRVDDRTPSADGEDGWLPYTGANLVPRALLGMALILVGLACTGTARRRRSTGA